MTRLTSSLARKAPFSWRTMANLRLGVICVAVLVGTSTLAGAASGGASAGQLSARLTKTSFTSAQAGSVKLVCKFKTKSGSFSYALTFKKGTKWQTVKSAEKSYKNGAYTTTVKKVFAGKAIKLGGYRLKISAGRGSKTLNFTVIKGVKPVNTSVPKISGTTRQGQTLTVTKGSWKNSPTSYSHQWQRCNSSGGSCANIASATSGTYLLAAADVGKTIRTAVRAKNAYGSASATSSQTAVVAGVAAGLPPTNSGLPTISGAAKDSNTLTASNGSWNNSVTAYAYQWRRCDGSGANCTDIASAAANSYALGPADDHSTIRVQVTASNSQGSAAATSAQTSAVSAIVTSVSSGGESSCAVLSDGNVECWGENEHGQLGNGTTTTSPTPVQVSGISNAIQVSVGGDHACAVLSDHSVKCWGVNTYGQLGNGATLPAADSDTPVQVYSSGTTPLTGVTHVSAGNIHTCALLTGGTLECWGYDGSGELGNGATNSTGIATPVPVYESGTSGSLFSNVTQVSAGDEFTCAVADGNAYCWGYNGYWGLGNISSYDQYNPYQVANFSVLGATVSSVSAGQIHACAVISASSAHYPGTVWCWGENSYDDLGTGSSLGSSRAPEQVVALNNGTGYLTGATAVSVGRWHTCALVSGSVECWGNNGWGQRGNPSGNSDLNYPVAAGSISGAAALDSGDYFNCALLSDHTITCWGDNSTDQLGTGKIGSSQTPLTVSGSWATPSHVSVGGEHVCTVDSSDGSVWCWGSNNDGQLGNGTTTDSSTPVKVVGVGGSGFLTGATQVSAGGFHTCALVGANVYCWGADYYGQLGDNITLPASSSAASPTPIEVKTTSSTFLAGVTQVSAGGSHTCAVKSDNTAWCWGRNTEGQLGNNPTSNSSLALQVKGVSGISYLTNVTQVSAGAYHSCAVTSAMSGNTYCWGSNSYGQIGVNLTANPIPYPMEVWAWNGTGITFLQAASVSAGADSSCAVDASGYAYCWGHNYFGQLGNGASSADQIKPVRVYASGASPSGTLLTNVSQISVGPEHACVHVSIPGHPTPPISLPHNNAYCWGYNNTGQLGDGTLDNSSNPVTAIATIFGVTEVSAGGSDNDGDGVSCAMVSGSVECWGSNYYGQLGSPALPMSVDPVAVGGLPLGV